MTTVLEKDILIAAVQGLEAQKARIELQIAEALAMLNNTPLTVTEQAPASPKNRKRRKMSAAGRKAIADAQRARWAKAKKAAVKKTKKDSEVPF